MSDEVVRYVDINDLDSITIYHIEESNNVIRVLFYSIVRLGLLYDEEEYLKNKYLYDTIFDIVLKYIKTEDGKYTYEISYSNDNFALNISDEYIDDLYNYIEKYKDVLVDFKKYSLVYYGKNSCRHINVKDKDKDYQLFIAMGSYCPIDIDKKDSVPIPIKRDGSDEADRYIDIDDLDNIIIYNVEKPKDNTLYLQFYAIVRLGLVYTKNSYKNNPYLYDTLFDVNLTFRLSEDGKYTYEVYYKNDDYVLLISDEYIDNLYKNAIKFYFASIDCTHCNIIYSDEYKYGRVRQKCNDKDYMYILSTGINSSITIDPTILSIEPYTEDYLVSIIRKDKDNESNGKFDKGIIAKNSDKITEIVKEYIAIDDVCMITINKYGK